MTPTEKKDAYKAKQRAVEAARRAQLGLATYAQLKPPKRRVRKTTEPRPAYGTQQWAETYRDDEGTL